MQNLSPKTIVQRLDQDIVDANLDDSLVLLHVEHGKYYDLNQTSSSIWNWLKEPLSVEELSFKLSEVYDCTKESCYNDVVSFLHQLIKLELLSIK